MAVANQIVLIADRDFSSVELDKFNKNISERWPDDLPKPIIITGFHTAFKI